MKQKSGGIRRLMEFTEKHRGLLTVSRVLFSVSSASILGPFLRVYPTTCKSMVVFTGTSLDTQGLVYRGILALFLELTRLLLCFGTLLCSRVVALHTERNLKTAAPRHLVKMPMGYFNLNPSDKPWKIIDENSFQTETFITYQLPDLIGARVTVVISLILTLTFDRRADAPLLLFFGIGLLLQGSLMGKDGTKSMQTYQNLLETMNHETVEYIRGISVVKIFGQTVQSITKFHDATKSYRKFVLAYTMSCKGGVVAFNSVTNSSLLMLALMALIIDLVSADLVGFIRSFLFYLIFSPACAVMPSKIMYMTSYKVQAGESMRRIDMILTTEPQAEVPVSKHLKGYDVSFGNVTFACENTDHPAVFHLDLTTEVGIITILVGYSDSGKGTTVSLIPRLYDVQEGAVKIGGVDIREIAHADPMKTAVLMFQDLKLFKDSPLEDIQAGRPMAMWEEVPRAACMAQCGDTLEKFSGGTGTVVGSKGVYLSSGGTQRIAVVRAIFKDAPIVVLDEVTAYAGPENKQQIQQAFKNPATGKTVIVITHRLSTVQDTDLISAMKNDELMENGTCDALVQQNGEYAKMWANYTKTIKWYIGNEVKVC